MPIKVLNFDEDFGKGKRKNIFFCLYQTKTNFSFAWKQAIWKDECVTFAYGNLNS